MSDGWMQGIVERLKVSIYGLYRGIRRFYYRIKVRSVAKAMDSESSDDFDHRGGLG